MREQHTIGKEGTTAGRDGATTNSRKKISNRQIKKNPTATKNKEQYLLGVKDRQKIKNKLHKPA